MSRALRLEFNHLKRAAEADGAKGRKRAMPAFVELIAPQPSGRECALELEAPRGKLRIEFKGMGLAELADISRLLADPSRVKYYENALRAKSVCG